MCYLCQGVSSSEFLDTKKNMHTKTKEKQIYWLSLFTATATLKIINHKALPTYCGHTNTPSSFNYSSKGFPKHHFQICQIDISYLYLTCFWKCPLFLPGHISPHELQNTGVRQAPCAHYSSQAHQGITDVSRDRATAP